MPLMFQPRRFGPGAGLASTDLSDADLSGFDPRGDSLPDGDLAGASLPYADLAHAVRTGLGPLPGQGTDLDWANLEPARLAGAICGARAASRR